MGLVGQNQQTTFANPQNGQAPDADVIRGNDNAAVAKHNAHDADATIHTQTGLLSARPAAGTAGAVYIDENKRIYVDNGTAWGEVPYARLDAAGTNVFVNNVEVGGALNVGGTTSLGTVNAGAVSASSVSIGGTASASTFSGSGASLTGIPQSAVTNLTTDLAGKAATSHNHAASQITSGTLADARLPATMDGKTLTNATLSSGSAFVATLGTATGFYASGTSTATAYLPDGNMVSFLLPNGFNPATASGSLPGGFATSCHWIRFQGTDGNTYMVPAVRGSI